MASQIVMDRTGDTRHIFNNQDRAEVAKAEQRFMELTGEGFTAAVRTGPGEQRVIRSFDPTAEETLFYPRLIGGWLVSGQILHAVGSCGLALLLWALLLVVLPSGSRSETNVRALTLLKEWLSPEQRASYERLGYFEVVGSDTGKSYRIHHGTQTNIEELSHTGQRVCKWCFVPDGDLVAGDVMLAQKIALETNERGALTVAHRSVVSM
jgi:hypothetical protein